MAIENRSSASAQPAKPNFDWKLLPDVLELLRPRRGALLVGFGLMVVNRVSGLVLPASTKYLVDDVITKRQSNLLMPIAGAVIIATMVQGLSSYTLTQLLSKSSQRMISDLRLKVQSHIGRLPVSFYDSNKTGALVSRIMNDVEGVQNLIGTGLIDTVGGILTAMFASVILLRISASMTAIAFALLLVFGVGLNRAFKAIRQIYRARPKMNAEVTGRLIESLGGVRVVKGYRAEHREATVFAKGVQRLLDNVLKSLNGISLMNFSVSTLKGVVGATIMFLGARNILAGTMTLGSFFTFTIFLALLIAPVFQIVTAGPQIIEALAGLERTSEILNEKREGEEVERTQNLGRLQGRVAFEKVSFSYQAGKPVLHDISFEAEPGSVTALVGPSGAGKSTIIGLIAAFYLPGSGRVLVDGFDLAHVRLQSYRTQLGVVMQETFLFDGTIRENVAFSRPASSEENLLAACRIARVDEFTECLPKKYDTIVGERGVRLSGGQRQRVSIARAILADPRILILDEATSSLDSESEAFIQQGLGYLMRGRTTFVIAHRLSTVRQANQILVLDAGRIVERGTHESLCALNGYYFNLHANQSGVESKLSLVSRRSSFSPD